MAIFLFKKSPEPVESPMQSFYFPMQNFEKI